MEIWVQAPLFETDDLRPKGRSTAYGLRALLPPHPAPADQAATARCDHTRVTRDPAVARSHGEQAQLASEMRLGLARALSQLSAEQRAAIARALAPTDRPSAA